MKTLNFVLIALFLSLCICDTDESTQYCGDKKDPQKAEDCINLEISPKDENGKYCCFEKSSEGTICEVYTQSEYDEIEDDVDEVKEAGLELSIECGSNYIIISLWSLILLFL